MVESLEFQTVGELYNRVKSLLKPVTEAYDYESRLLLSFILDENSSVVYTRPEKPVERDKAQKVLELARKRSEGMPLQYLMKTTYFMGFEFEVDRNVLIPRPDTEILVQKSLELLSEGGRVLDMGTGSGCIAVSLALLNRHLFVDAADISDRALKVAKRNVERYELSNRIRLVQSDLFSNLTNIYDMIVSNPPYIRREEYESLDREVRCYEPIQALVAEEDGLYFYKRIAKQGCSYLKAGGFLLFETGYDQAPKVASIMEKEGFVDLEITKDFNGINRVVSGRK